MVALESRRGKLAEEATGARAGLVRHAERLSALEADATSLRKEGSEQAAGVRQLKSQIKEVSDGLTAHKREARRNREALDQRCEAYDAGIASFAEHLKIANPVAAVLSAAAAAL